MAISAKIADSILNSRPLEYLTKPNAASAAATIALVSNLSKDGVNCYYYVTQSLHNEKIPEEKRKFVASLDLSNGILNVITQLAVGIPIVKQVNKVFDKHIAPKYFSKEAAENMYKKLKPEISLDKFTGLFAKNKGFAKTGLGVIATLVGTQIIAKRILVPLIATPMATFFKNKMEKGAKPVQAPANNNQPAAKTPTCFKRFEK